MFTMNFLKSKLGWGRKGGAGKSEDARIEGEMVLPPIPTEGESLRVYADGKGGTKGGQGSEMGRGAIN